MTSGTASTSTQSKRGATKRSNSVMASFAPCPSPGCCVLLVGSRQQYTEQSDCTESACYLKVLEKRLGTACCQTMPRYCHWIANLAATYSQALYSPDTPSHVCPPLD
eukprot:2592993-Amphidinium_carterae.1